jgi:hypothetical protein
LDEAAEADFALDEAAADFALDAAADFALDEAVAADFALAEAAAAAFALNEPAVDFDLSLELSTAPDYTPKPLTRAPRGSNDRAA